jgi:hypothetical protein
MKPDTKFNRIWSRILDDATDIASTIEKAGYSLESLQIDTSHFQNEVIYSPIRKKLGWTQDSGWKKDGEEITQLQKQLTTETGISDRKTLLNKIVEKRYGTSQDYTDRNKGIAEGVVFWLETEGLFHCIDDKMAVFLPSPITGLPFEWIPSFLVPSEFAFSCIEYLLHEKKLNKMITSPYIQRARVRG